MDSTGPSLCTTALADGRSIQNAAATGVGVALPHRVVGPASRAGARHGALHRGVDRRGWA